MISCWKCNLWCCVRATWTFSLFPYGQRCKVAEAKVWRSECEKMWWRKCEGANVKRCDGEAGRCKGESVKLQRQRSDTTITSLPSQLHNSLTFALSPYGNLPFWDLILINFSMRLLWQNESETCLDLSANHHLWN